MLDLIQKYIYPRIPVVLQNLAISAYGVYWHSRRFGGHFLALQSEFKSRESLSKEQLHIFQNQKLKNILLHAFDNVPYYKEMYSKQGLKRENLANITIDNISQISFLEKDEFRKFGTTSLLSSQRLGNGKFYQSSGSTGTPVSVFFSRATHQEWSAAFECRIRNWAGINNKTPRGMIGGRRILTKASDGPPYYRYNIIEKQVYFSAYHISSKSAYNYAEAMWKYNLQYMTGYAVSNYLLALIFLEKNIEVPKMKAVITSSEKLTPEMRDVLEKVYQCKVYDSWSGVEACALVSECEYGSLHISDDVGLVEILDENGNEVKEGETGEVVCTGFLNYDQPLIRYRIGDRMTKGEGNCECGRNFTVIKEIDGRLEDIVTGPDGRKMVRFHSVFLGIHSIERAQIVQNSLNNLHIRIQNKVKLTEEEKILICSRTLSQLGNIEIIISEHEHIEQTSNGKYKAVVSKINSI